MKSTQFSRANRGNPSVLGKYALVAFAAVALNSPLFENAANAQTEPVQTPEPAKAAQKTDPQPAKTEPITLTEITVRSSPSTPNTAGTPDQNVALQTPKAASDATRRPETLNHDFDIGGHAIVNEAGQSVFASIEYKKLLGFDAGNIWFGPQAAPFATVSIRPELNVWRFKGIYYGRVSTLGYMPSWFDTSHALGLGYLQPLDKNEDWKLRLGAVAGGAISYPTFDDMYSSLSAGASLQYKGALLYAAPNFYWAAKTPTQTAYYGYYRPKLQDVDMGVQVRFLNEYIAGIFADVGVLKSTYTVRAARSLVLGDQAELTAYVGTGATHWIEDLGGMNAWVVMGGMTLAVGGRYVNSTSTVRFEHFQAAGIPLQVKTDIPTKQDPGPYGFGRAGSQAWIGSINAAKQRMYQNSDWNSFVSSYGNESEEGKIAAARFLLAFMGQAAYANNAAEALFQGDVFNPDVKRIASTDLNTIYGYVSRYADWYDNNNGPLPQDLKNGIAVCAGAHELAMDFLNRNGVPAKVMSVNTPGGPHTIVMATPASGTYLLDWGNQYMSGQNTWDQLLRFYGQRNGAPTYESQIFGPKGYMGTYVTPEGRLLHETIGTYTPSILKHDFLGVF